MRYRNIERRVNIERSTIILISIKRNYLDVEVLTEVNMI